MTIVAMANYTIGRLRHSAQFTAALYQIFSPRGTTTLLALVTTLGTWILTNSNGAPQPINIGIASLNTSVCIDSSKRSILFQPRTTSQDVTLSSPLVCSSVQPALRNTSPVETKSPRFRYRDSKRAKSASICALNAGAEDAGKSLLTYSMRGAEPLIKGEWSMVARMVVAPSCCIW